MKALSRRLSSLRFTLVGMILLAVGAARAMARTGLPFVVSWVLGADTRVLDGTPLAEAIRVRR